VIPDAHRDNVCGPLSPVGPARCNCARVPRRRGFRANGADLLTVPEVTVEVINAPQFQPQIFAGPTCGNVDLARMTASPSRLIRPGTPPGTSIVPVMALLPSTSAVAASLIPGLSSRRVGADGRSSCHCCLPCARKRHDVRFDSAYCATPRVIAQRHTQVRSTCATARIWRQRVKRK
jgi:hypothetical protein